MLTTLDIITATRGALLDGSKIKRFKSVSIDSRKIKPGALFIAIVGQRFDGHKFIEEAIEQGAVGVVVSKKIKINSNVVVVRVEDTTQALGQIAGFYRQQFNIPVVAITGSAGKTTTKEMIAAVLKSKWRVLKNYKTENNQFGVPLTLLKLKRTHNMVVLELGTNRPGDIAWLARIAQPTVAVFTNIGESHLEELKSAKGVFQEKLQLIKYLHQDGKIVYNMDDAYLKKIKVMKTSQRKISYSIEQKADVSVDDRINLQGRFVKFTIKNVKFMLKSPAAHNVLNALATVCVGRCFSMKLEEINKCLNRFTFVDGRQKWSRQGSFWLIDDSYNSNPISFRSAIETLDALNIKGRKILICADMLELGENSKRLHELMGQRLLQSSVNMVFTIGKHAQIISQVLKSNINDILAVHYADVGELHRQLKDFCQKGDVLLIKGSRGMQLDQTVKFLQQNHN